MSLVRGLTKRVKRSGSDTSKGDAPKLSRSQSLKFPKLQVDRSQISSPVALVSTTNMLSYNAPDITATRHVSSSSTSSSHSSSDDSDNSTLTRSRASSHGSRDNLTDASSVESSPTLPAPNHLTGYFSSASKHVRKSASINSISLHQVQEEPVGAAPDIPRRAFSHSKHAHERLAHKRSLQNMNRSSLGSSRKSYEHRSSIDMFSATIQEEDHPFGRELEQLNEVVEEFGGVVRDAEREEDFATMRQRDLAAFCVADYLTEIQPLFSVRFATAPMAWI